MSITKKYVNLNFDIKPYNIDAAGHVNNCVYILWFEDLRVKLFNDCYNFQKLFNGNIYPVVVSTNIKYKRFLKLFDKPIGVVHIESCSHNVFTLNFEIKLNGASVVNGTQKCIMYDLVNSKIKKVEELCEFL